MPRENIVAALIGVAKEIFTNNGRRAEAEPRGSAFPGGAWERGRVFAAHRPRRPSSLQDGPMVDSELTLVERAQRGDHAAFEELVRSAARVWCSPGFIWKQATRIRRRICFRKRC